MSLYLTSSKGQAHARRIISFVGSSKDLTALLAASVEAERRIASRHAEGELRLWSDAALEAVHTRIERVVSR